MKGNTLMLLPSAAKCQPLRFPNVEQLSSVERRALQEQLPELVVVMRRVSHSYLGPAVHLETAEVLNLPAERQGLAAIEGPTLRAKFDEMYYLIVKLDQTVASACVVALLGAAVGGPEWLPQLTPVDMAILRPYVAALATGLVRTAFRSGIHDVEFLPPHEANQLISRQDAVAILFPARLGLVSGQIGIVAPAGAWRAAIPTPYQAGQRLALGQLGHVPVRLEAVIAGAAVSLTDILTLEPGDIIPLSAGDQMVVHLRAGPCTVACGRAGAQAERLAVRLTDIHHPKEA